MNVKLSSSAFWLWVFALAVLLWSGGSMTASAAELQLESTGDDLSLLSSSALLLPAPSISATQALTETEPVTPTRDSIFKLPSKPKSDAADAESDSDDAAAAEESAAAEEAAGAEAESAFLEGAAQDLEEAQRAIVQIQAIGSFVDPADGLQLNTAGSGTGFIIDPEGIAVTNNHVVAGAAFLKVFMEGEESALNARVLGVSECSDLAVIDIQGEGYPYLAWYDEAIKVGLDVYAAGYPLGDPEFTLTRGIVSKARAGGDTNWASIEQVLQHDATINPGNSGGPLIDADGHVVGVNYAGNASTVQYFAISRDDAIPVIEALRSGEDVDSIGINGQAFSDGETLSGIWVASVVSGSPADESGIEPGDIIVSLEGISLATDGTMADYCNVLRSHDPADVLTLEVLRFDTQEMLEGQLNGRKLEQSFSFADELAEESENNSAAGTSTAGAAGSGEDYAAYESVSDADGVISVEVPTAWPDVSVVDWEVGEDVAGIKLFASPDQDDFESSWGVPGVVFSVSTSLVKEYTQEDLLDSIDYEDSCEYEGRTELPDGFYSGSFDRWLSCGGEGETTALIAALVPETDDFIIRIEVYMSSDADVKALDRILDSFVINIPTSNRSAEIGGSGSGEETLLDLVDTADLVYDFVELNDPGFNALIPDAWEDVQFSTWLVDDELYGLALSASTDVDGYYNNWTTPGMYVRSSTDVSDDVDLNEILDDFDLSGSCTYNERVEHAHEIYGISYVGFVDIWINCDETENAFAFMAVVSDPIDHLILIEYQAETEADVEAFGVLAQSFYVDASALDQGIAEAADAGTEPVVDEDESDFVQVSNEAGTFSLNLPKEWNDIRDVPWELDDGVIGTSLTASNDLEEYDTSWAAPGMYLGIADQLDDDLTPQDVLDLVDFADDCTFSDRFDYDDGTLLGGYDLWTDCGDIDTLLIVLSAKPDGSPQPLILFNIVIPGSSGVDAFEEILATFRLYDVEETSASGTGSGTGSGSDSGASSSATATRSFVAEVQVPTLNVRSGPGTNFSRVGAVNRGDQLLILGQVNDCSWLNVTTPNGTAGWTAGTAQFVSIDAPCSRIPEAAPPAAGAGSSSGSSSSSGSADTGGKGCYTFQNQLGAEINITFNGNGVSETFKVPKSTEVEKCYNPGKYTYTLDAPPPWGSTNGELTINIGDNFYFPIRAE